MFSFFLAVAPLPPPLPPASTQLHAKRNWVLLSSNQEFAILLHNTSKIGLLLVLVYHHVTGFELFPFEN